ncbi:MAG: M3 family oligoendopeptidase [Phycisphaerae bacterium]|nr:M3 family oligoendopeptidase [Phycisphaerae bacterium]
MKQHKQNSRRDFLKVSALTVAGLWTGTKTGRYVWGSATQPASDKLDLNANGLNTLGTHMIQKDRSYPRQFVPADANMGNWAHIEPLFDRLDVEPIDTLEQMEAWLLHQSELLACISEESSDRYVKMTCQTDDEQKEKAYLQFVEEIDPKCKPRWQRLGERYVRTAERSKLPSDRYAVLDRSTLAAVELFRQENVPLQTEEARLDQQHQKITGAMTVTYDGKEQTLSQMSRYLEQPDRNVRQEAWTLIGKRRLQDRDALDDIFDQMISLRTKMAQNAGLPTFREYQWKAYGRFDYSPADCIAFHQAIEKLVVPVNREIQQHRQRELGVDPLRPWDLAVDPKNRQPLRPFKTSDELCRLCSTAFGRIDPELGRQFDKMVAAGWLDLDSRKGKAPGGYQTTYDERRFPFIFMNAVGMHRDVETLLHEGGHAFHAMACRDEPLMAYRHCGMEMAEVASMRMELLAYDHLDVFYSGDDLQRARRDQLEGVISVFPWIATIDAFQHWIYTNPTHTRQQRTQTWLSLAKRFGGIEDWTGYEPMHEAQWQRQLHLFSVPFYYVEYGIAQIGALQLWVNARKDKQAALKRYREALALGGSRPLPELWAAAGLKFDFTAQTLQPLIDAVQKELEQLGA